MTAYDPDNIFGKILKGEIPSHKVYEDDETLAFMDVMPQSQGHTLVIPKSGSRNLLDAEPEVLAGLIRKTQTVARAVKSAMAADGLRIMQFNEAAAGQTVFHLHFHIIPIYEGVPLKPHSGDMADHSLLATQAEKIRALL
ncbi:HIT family protein [Pelagibacterium lacus]|uniref:HIT family protein n=1 Tax=Pelagibacterium lacus TaxID=2282655 RepID=A0A369W5G1_9HYPH|nr:HIT family protein [Pelagibacterium lacus]RDE09798.1 HIT family protein [Pelagibacterium lacus]